MTLGQSVSVNRAALQATVCVGQQWVGGRPASSMMLLECEQFAVRISHTKMPANGKEFQKIILLESIRFEQKPGERWRDAVTVRRTVQEFFRFELRSRQKRPNDASSGLFGPSKLEGLNIKVTNQKIVTRKPLAKSVSQRSLARPPPPFSRLYPKYKPIQSVNYRECVFLINFSFIQNFSISVLGTGCFAKAVESQLGQHTYTNWLQTV